MKKIKNPEKYIQKLKCQVKRMETSLDYWRNLNSDKAAELNELRQSAFGAHWFTYESGVTNSVSHSSNGELTKNVTIGKQVVILGSIMEFQRSANGKNSTTFELKKVYMK